MSPLRSHGFRLALRTGLTDGLILGWALVPAAVDERRVADGLLEGVRDGGLLTDDPGVAGVNNPTSFVVTIPPTANVNGTKTVTGNFTPGGSITYTVTLSNTGTLSANDNAGNEFTDVLPASLTLVSASASAGTAVANVGTKTVTWNGTIPASGSVMITINATINAGTGAVTITMSSGTTTGDIRLGVITNSGGSAITISAASTSNIVELNGRLTSGGDVSVADRNLVIRADSVLTSGNGKSVTWSGEATGKTITGVAGGETISASMPHEWADAMRRLSS